MRVYVYGCMSASIQACTPQQPTNSRNSRLFTRAAYAALHAAVSTAVRLVPASCRLLKNRLAR